MEIAPLARIGQQAPARGRWVDQGRQGAARLSRPSNRDCAFMWYVGDAMSDQVLSGITVIDLTQYIAGPWKDSQTSRDQKAANAERL
jgi:hypothetical protein